MKQLKKFTVKRNIPFIDTKGLGFYYQKINYRYWIEIPFFAFSFKIAL